MNDEKVFNNIKSIIFSVVLLILLLWGIITSAQLIIARRTIQRVERQLESTRTELESAQNRERELTETVGNIRSITERTDEILGESTDAIKDIREKIQILENYVYSIDKYLNTIDSNNDS